MNAFSKFIRFAIYGAVLVCARYGFAQGVPCSEAKPEYYSPTPDRAKHLSISRESNGTFDQPKKITSQLGPNSWFVTVDTCEIEWPPRSGRRLEIPEVDRGRWLSIEEARRFIREEQRPLLDNLWALSIEA